MRGALGVSAATDDGRGQSEVTARGIERGGGRNRAVRAAEQRFGASGLVQSGYMLTVAFDAHAAQLAQISGLAASVLQRGQSLTLLCVRRLPEHVDGAADAARFRLFRSGRTERALAEEQAAKGEASQSATFGGGPIWMRSPM